MLSVRSLKAEEDWNYLYHRARKEFKRLNADSERWFDDRTQILFKYLVDRFGDLTSDLVAGRPLDCSHIGELIDDLWDLVIMLETRFRDEAKLEYCRVFFTCVLVVVCRATPGYGPPIHFGYLKYLVLRVKKEGNTRLARAIVAVVNGSTKFEKALSKET